MREPIQFLMRCILLLTFTTVPTVSFADDTASDLDIDITGFTIEEILNTKITSVSKTPERASQAPAAVYVLTNESIRRSGATSIPEALRLVPGVQVARIDANKWAVSIRGFNSRAANKLLVLIDGRSIYDLLFTGVLWETKDVMLEDVDRIEVVRGPGATLWGANAVNGVINIITKRASETQGGLVTGGGGTEERAFGSARYGVQLSEDHYLRFYGKALERDDGYLPEGSDDDSEFGQAGFRYDGELTPSDTLTFQGDFYQGEQDTPDEMLSPETETSGGNVLGRWQRSLENQDKIELAFYYDHSELFLPTVGEIRNTYDLNLQYKFAEISDHSILWGLRYNYSEDEIIPFPGLTLIPLDRGDQLISGFVQDQIELVPDTLSATVGSKFEHNDYTGFEVQPSVRLGWTMNERNDLLWAAVSRAVRIPSRLESDFFAELPDGSAFTGNKYLEAEDLIAYETGVKVKATDELILDLALFYNDYDNLFSVEGLTAGNKLEATGYGGEIAMTYVPYPWWRTTAGYSYLQIDPDLDSSSLSDPASTEAAIDGNDPNHQAFLRTGFDIYESFEFDFGFRYVDSLPAQDVESYIVGDVRLAAHISESLELSVVAQNLLDDHHFEQGTGLVSQVEHGVYGKILYSF